MDMNNWNNYGLNLNLKVYIIFRHSVLGVTFRILSFEQ